MEVRVVIEPAPAELAGVCGPAVSWSRLSALVCPVLPHESPGVGMGGLPSRVFHES